MWALLVISAVYLFYWMVFFYSLSFPELDGVIFLLLDSLLFPKLIIVGEGLSLIAFYSAILVDY